MSRGSVRIAVVQPRSSIASLAGAIDFCPDGPESANLARAVEHVREAAAAGARLVAFPELFPGPSGEGSDLSFADVSEALRDVAARTGTCVCFGALRPVPGGARNTYLLADGPTGQLVAQDKVLPAIGESSLPGSGRPVLDLGEFRVGAAICWEAWFPETVRALALRGADLVLCPTGAIVQELHDVWLRVIGARAAENVCYTACSVNVLAVERGMAAVFAPERDLGSLDSCGVLVADLDLDRLDVLRAADDELTTLKRYATLPGLLRALPEELLLEELAALRERRA